MNAMISEERQILVRGASSVSKLSSPQQASVHPRWEWGAGG